MGIPLHPLKMTQAEYDALPKPPYEEGFLKFVELGYKFVSSKDPNAIGEVCEGKDLFVDQIGASLLGTPARGVRWFKPVFLKPNPYKNRTVPAANFVGTVVANVDNEKMSDEDFRQFVRNTLPIVQYDYGDRFHPYEEQDMGKGPRKIEEVEKTPA